VTGIPTPTLYRRSIGWHAPALRRAAVVSAVGLLAGLILLLFEPWELAVTGGSDIAALTFLGAVWPIILRADGMNTQQHATREDDTSQQATALLIGASTASLLAVGFVLGLAGRQNGAPRVLLVAFAMLTVTLSWVVINTVYTLRYAHLHYRAPGAGIAFGDAPDPKRADYRDFAYVAFTIGMTYQVSDTTLRGRPLRRTVLTHALISYLFGVIIVAGAINLIAGLIR
jgi:uncharacterized membrane protein